VKRLELPSMNYPLCMNCIRVADAMTAVSWQGNEPCVVCGGRGGCKPAGNKSVSRAFDVYYERLEMALSRASHGARSSATRKECDFVKSLDSLKSKCICPFGILRGDCPEHGALVP